MTDEERQEAQNILDQSKEWEQFWNSLQAEEATIESEAEARERLAKERLKHLQDHLPEIQEMIDHPSYYTGDIECIDAMLQTQGVEAVKAFCLCNAFKYLWRHKDKGGDEDIEKAVWYLEKYLEVNHVDQC